ncbi:oxygenase MpaB family protein [Patulibacter brassicae]|uniref:Oxygenase MpaB family protein n=1 Tax=Patulibacter brassicae TaxID=1705717 RepID=A0ABU4VPU1_9ACTN|nr:oxygenase MpaB family protein [Patulibacter brassicae]MDX8153877.1 oxygenase MpaB family protein [Patulibacter brassicae]
MPTTAHRPAPVRTVRDEGYFPPGSMLRRVQAEHAVGLLYGQRALCIGAIKPLNYVGTSEHTANKREPFKRLVRTGLAFEQVFFGTRAEADAVLRYVRRMHERVVGTLPEDGGATPAGTAYSALDGPLMRWTVAVMMDSAEVLHDLLVRRLAHEEREALWQDYRRFAVLFGTPEGALPVSYPAFRAYFDAEVAGADAHLTDEAHHVGRFSAFSIPVPPLRRPAMSVQDLVILGSLPERVRELYGLPYHPAQRALHGAVCAAARHARRVTPTRLATGRNTAVFRSVAAEEERRIRTGRRTPQVV